MGNWLHTVNIKPSLDLAGDVRDRDPVPLEVLESLVQVLQSNPLTSPYIRRFKHCKTVRGFNNVLANLYNYADRERIWLGL